MKRKLKPFPGPDAPPTPADLTSREISGLAGTIHQVLSRIPEVSLTRRQRGRADSYMFPKGHLVADEVIRALRDGREIFPDVTVSPEALEKGRRQAEAWYSLADAARSLYESAMLNYLLEESGTTASAVRVVLHVRQGGHSLFALRPPELEDDRAFALGRAEDMLAEALFEAGRRGSRKRSKG